MIPVTGSFHISSEENHNGKYIFFGVQQFHTFAHYVSDASGMVDVEHNEALGGAFKGIFPAGLFSSLKEYPFHYTRLQKEDTTSPWKVGCMPYYFCISK